MHYVYILQSQSNTDQLYTGYTTDLKQRLNTHNNGKVSHTKKFIPWELKWYSCFSCSKKATAFEKYLKSNSGRGFRNKRLII